jgi:hypothetical protein
VAQGRQVWFVEWKASEDAGAKLNVKECGSFAAAVSAAAGKPGNVHLYTGLTGTGRVHHLYVSDGCLGRCSEEAVTS